MQSFALKTFNIFSYCRAFFVCEISCNDLATASLTVVITPLISKKRYVSLPM